MTALGGWQPYRTVRCSPRRTPVAHSGQPWACSPSPGRGRELGPGGLARAVRPKPVRDRVEDATSATTDQVVLEARGLLQGRAIRGYPWLKRLQVWTTWKRCRSIPVGPEAGRFYSSASHAGTTIRCAFSTFPEGDAPSDRSDGLGLISVRERMLISLRDSGRTREPPPKGRQPPKRWE